jgi:hypothetical protein
MNEKRVGVDRPDQVEIEDMLWRLFQYYIAIRVRLSDLIEDFFGEGSYALEKRLRVQVLSQADAPKVFVSGSFTVPLVPQGANIIAEKVSLRASQDLGMLAQHYLQPRGAAARTPDDEDQLLLSCFMHGCHGVIV